MKFDDIVHEYGIRMNRPLFVRAIRQDWDEQQRNIGCWRGDIWIDGRFFTVETVTSIEQHEEFHIPTLQDFLEQVQAIALSEMRTNEEESALYRALAILGVDAFNAIVNMED